MRTEIPLQYERVRVVWSVHNVHRGYLQAQVRVYTVDLLHTVVSNAGDDLLSTMLNDDNSHRELHCTTASCIRWVPNKVTNMSNACFTRQFSFLGVRRYAFMKFTEAAGGDHYITAARVRKHVTKLRRCRMTFLLVIFPRCIDEPHRGYMTAIVFAAYFSAVFKRGDEHATG